MSSIFPADDRFPLDDRVPGGSSVSPTGIGGDVPADVPHFRHPFSRSTTGKTVEVVDQDSVEEIRSCEAVIVACPVGFFPPEPDFGWPFPEFRNVPLDTTALRAALARFEPRGDANVEQWLDEADAAVTHFRINVGPHMPDQGGE